MNGRRSGLRWRLASASVRGSGHEKTGQVCQDACRVARLPGDVLVAAVADGAGSAAHGEVGSSLAVQAAISAIVSSGTVPAREEDLSALLRSAFAAALEEIEKQAAAMGVYLRDLATTLIVAIATPEQAVAGQVGDGAVVVADRTGELTLLTVPQNGEYLNETVFLVDRDTVTSMETKFWRGEGSYAI